MTMRRPYPFPPHYPYNMDMAVANQYFAASYDPQYNRKRQRRQAAAVVVESLWNNNNAMGRKSTAQPRPVLTVPPRGIGPIVEPNENDVLCGRGGRINSHPGNVQFRDVINARKKEYLAPSTKKLEKAHIAAAIVSDIRYMDPPGRFLKEDRDTGLWFDIGDAKAIKKTGQALREDAPDIRHELEEDDSSEEEKGKGSDNEKKVASEEAESGEKKSPKASPNPKVSTSPTRKVPQPSSAVPAQSPQKMVGQTAVWPQGNVQMTPQDYQAQIAMPPPYSNQFNNNMYPPQHLAQMQGFETRNIPIQAPAPMHQNTYSLPNQLYAGARSVTGKVASVSRHAMAALHPSRQQDAQYVRPPDDIAFGRTFHPPVDSTILSSDNTLSTISGLSEPMSSNIGSGISMGGGRGSGFMGLDNMSCKSSTLSGPNSMRPSNLGIRGGGRQLDNATASGFHGSMRSANGSLTRSFSFPDMGSFVEGDVFRSIMEADDELIDETAAKSILSGGSSLVGYGSGGRAPRNSSGMSISGLSMDLASNASSTQWLAAAGLGNVQAPDDRTFASGMSTDLDALDLAAPDQFRM